MTKPAVHQPLNKAAHEVSQRAYSPYSGYKVGAATIDQGGHIHAACNMENASYGLTQCAERNALAAAVAAGARRGELREMVVFFDGPEPLPPCGACRQVIAELMTEDGSVWSTCNGEDFLYWTVADLLPLPFLPDP